MEAGTISGRITKGDAVSELVGMIGHCETDRQVVAIRSAVSTLVWLMGRRHKLRGNKKRRERLGKVIDKAVEEKAVDNKPTTASAAAAQARLCRNCWCEQCNNMAACDRGEFRPDVMQLRNGLNYCCDYEASVGNKRAQ